MTEMLLRSFLDLLLVGILSVTYLNALKLVYRTKSTNLSRVATRQKISQLVLSIKEENIYDDGQPPPFSLSSSFNTLIIGRIYSRKKL